tara:strand:+ start:128 stop:601 length:474 start_codon:yes stop_codon:yes gene_type:complete
MNKLEEKRINSKNIKKHIITLFKTKIDSFYVWYNYDHKDSGGDGLDSTDAEWGDDNGPWRGERAVYYEKYLAEDVEDKIYDFIYDYFNPQDYYITDGYCQLIFTNNKLILSFEEDTERAVEFDFNKMQHIEKEFSKDYKPLLIKWEITDKGIIEIKE